MDEPQPESTTKQPDRIATSKVERLMEESREYLQVTQASAEEAANNAELAAKYAARVADSNYYALCVFAVVAGGLLAAELLAFIVIVFMAVLHVIVL